MAQQRLLWHEILADYVSKVYITQYLCLPQHRHPKVEKFAVIVEGSISPPLQ